MIAATGSAATNSINNNKSDMTVSEFISLLPPTGWVFVGISVVALLLLLRWGIKKQDEKYRFRGPF